MVRFRFWGEGEWAKPALPRLQLIELTPEMAVGREEPKVNPATVMMILQLTFKLLDMLDDKDDEPENKGQVLSGLITDVLRIAKVKEVDSPEFAGLGDQLGGLLGGRIAKIRAKRAAGSQA